MIAENLDPETIEFSEPVKPIDSAPKRGRGRPPGSKNKTTSSASSSAPTSNINGARAARRGSKAFVNENCVTLVGLGNIALSFASKEDALDEREMTALADALTAEAMTSERIMRWMTAAGSVTPHIAMISAAVMIAVPRLQRRGILPAPATLTPEQYASLTPEQREQYDEYIRNRVSASQTPPESQRASDTPDTTVQMETGRTSQFDGGYR